MPNLRPAFKSLLVLLMAVSCTAPVAHATETVQRPHWPLQQRPGPDGDPKQDPATFPRSSVPPSPPLKHSNPARPALADKGAGNWSLEGAWKLQAVIKVPDTIRELAQPGYDTSTWYAATVPGTVLTTLVNEGVYPEPTYGLNNLAIPESLARQDWWYRSEFTLPATFAGKTLTLTFNGINYSAEVWFNGKRLGDIRGAFARGIFDLTALAKAGESNALAVRISPPPHPGIPHEESLAAGAGVPNGGTLTYDGPNFFCTEGWDWIPGIRDRCSGIWQDVVLHVSGPVVISDPQVVTDLPLPDTSTAAVTISAHLENRSTAPQTFTLRATFDGVAVEKQTSLAAGAGARLTFSPADFPALNVPKPRLWWPNGYGDPELYALKLSILDASGQENEVKTLRFGIREVTYELSAFDSKAQPRRFDFNPSIAGKDIVIDKRNTSIFETPEAWLPSFAPGKEDAAGVTPIAHSSTAPFLVIKVNGVPVSCKGGNWGLDEALKRCSREKLEPYFRLHRDAHLTMVRNWCGQNTEEVFFDLADEYGLMVWSDFWMSTHDWNQQPGDLPLFLANAKEAVVRFRNHPSIVIWCGRNEGVPPPELNEGLDELIRHCDGTRYYQPNSNKVSLLDSGPWVYGDPVNFFNKFGLGFSTELGLPNAPTADAIKAMMPAPDQWPLSDTWAYHDWHQAHHGEVQTFMKAMEVEYGAGTSLEDFSRKAQMINYVSHRALFEGLNARLWQPASGRLMWMSHPAWGSTEWQLYTADYDTNGAYFGAQKACEPVHVQLNLDDRQVVVANTTRTTLANVVVKAELFDLKGRMLGQQSASVSSPANATTTAFRLDETPAAALPIHFVKLTLSDSKGAPLSDNFYWRPGRDEDHQLLNSLPLAPLAGTARQLAGGKIEVEIENASPTPALLIKPTLRTGSGERVLPAHASDGGFSLLPGEKRHFTIEAPRAPAGNLVVTAEGWNLAPLSIVVIRH